MARTLIRYGKAYQKRVIQAAEEYAALQERRVHPDGEFDNAGRWYPSESEECDCCAVRSPSRVRPYSLMVHCRTALHVATRLRVEPSDVRAAAKDKDAWLKKARTEDRKRKGAKA